MPLVKGQFRDGKLIEESDTAYLDTNIQNEKVAGIIADLFSWLELEKSVFSCYVPRFIYASTRWFQKVRGKMKLEDAKFT